MSVGWLVGLSVIISQKSDKLYVRLPCSYQNICCFVFLLCCEITPFLLSMCLENKIFSLTFAMINKPSPKTLADMPDNAAGITDVVREGG